MRLTLIVISFFLSSNIYAAENLGSSRALKEYLATQYWMRGDIDKSAELISSIGPEEFLGRARTQFRNGSFEQAVVNLDIYLSLVDDNTMCYLLRGLSKKLSDSPDVDGACADLLKASSSGIDISPIDGIEAYCDSQSGWIGR